VKCHVELEQPKLLVKVASVASSGDADKVKSSEKQRCGLDLLFFLLLIITCHLYIKDILFFLIYGLSSHCKTSVTFLVLFSSPSPVHVQFIKSCCSLQLLV
jgi:uncharacterized membrane protein